MVDRKFELLASNLPGDSDGKYKTFFTNFD